MRRAGRRSLPVLFAVSLVYSALTAGPALGRLKPFPPEDITNFLLGPEYAQWLVGPLVQMAGDEERQQYLALSDDSAAEAFIEAFWERRGPNLVFPPTGPKITFERRAKEADRVFSEGTFLGRRTDRGTVYILYGSPETLEYASSPTGLGPPVTIWNFSKKAEAGLDGKRPDRRYGFRLQGSVTKFFSLAGVKKLRSTPALPGTRD